MKLFEKQWQFLNDFKSKKYKFMLYGGAVGGGKSMLLLGILHQMAGAYPGTRYGVFRKNLTTIKRTSIPTFKQVLSIYKHEELVFFNMSDYTVKYPNGSEISFIEADESKDRDFNKLKGIELTMSVIEEVNEISERAFSIVVQRTGRWQNAGHDIPGTILMNCNPSNTWVKRLFYDKFIAGTLKAPYYFLQSLPTDNPFLTQDYLDGLKSLPESEYQRYVLGNWEFSDDPNQLIETSWYNECVDESLKNYQYDLRDNRITALGVDVARSGDDRTVFVYFSFNRLCKIEVFTKKTTTEVARLIQQRSHEFNIRPAQIAVDVVGLGAGVFDSLADAGLRVIPFNSSNSPDDVPNKFNTFKNKRAQAIWEFREDIRLGEIKIIPNADLRDEATILRYSVDGKCIQIESKQSYKLRCGNSPDVFDAAYISNYIRRRATIKISDFGSFNIPKTLASEVSY